MLDLLWLVPTLPFAGFLVLTFFGPRFSRRLSAAIGIGAIGLATVVAGLVSAAFLVQPPADAAFTQTLWRWIAVGSFTPAIAFRLDALSLIMMLVVTFVSFVIHLYSAEYMQGEEGFSRFFAYMNLFVGAMLVLVLADDLLLLYLGWEGVGLCSYLLIGWWYRDPQNGYAARKAFVVTRVGDTAMAIGLFLIFTSLGTLNIQTALARAGQAWAPGSTLAVAAAALLLGGAVGKSAQLPLQTWLPDAMAGPTPVSALIHAATMVTAGVYLIARTHVLFELAPAVQLAVAVIGALTLLLAGFSALVQTDIKRVLAYSTISQIGYMFLALGVGAWSAAIFHFMTHAFFKALLFLGAGAIIITLHHEQDMLRMGGLRKQLPLVFWTFLIGAASLSALPLVTAGFYSKDLILFDAYTSSAGSPWLWAAGLTGAFLTALYTFRMVFLTFFGAAQRQVTHRPGPRVTIPLAALAVLSIIGGFVETPHSLGGVTLFSGLLESVLPAVSGARGGPGTELILELIAAVVTLTGIYLAYLFFLGRRQLSQGLARSPVGAALARFWHSGWAFDWLYDRLLVFPYVWLAQANRADVIDGFYRGIAWLMAQLGRALSATQSGQVRRYAAAVAVGAVLILAVVVLR